MHGAVVVPQYAEKGGGIRLKLDLQDQGVGKILDAVGQGEWRFLKIRQFLWTSYVYVPLSGITLSHEVTELIVNKYLLIDFLFYCSYIDMLTFIGKCYSSIKNPSSSGYGEEGSSPKVGGVLGQTIQADKEEEL